MDWIKECKQILILVLSLGALSGLVKYGTMDKGFIPASASIAGAVFGVWFWYMVIRAIYRFFAKRIKPKKEAEDEQQTG